MRLNKFLAHAGIASRRRCDDLIMAGYVKVNGKKVESVGVVIDEKKDIVTFKNKPVTLGKKYVYVLLNKPRGVVTTVSEQFRRSTVIDFIGIPERIYPVGRLDYNTTGVLLLTNDGELTNRLLHPNYKVKKKYRIVLNRLVRPIDLHQLQKGVELDGAMTLPCKITEIRRMDNRSVLEMELREGRNRQIRRMFELFDYQVEELNRIEFAGLTVKNLQPGEWRYLTEKEVERLKKRTSNGH